MGSIRDEDGKLFQDSYKASFQAFGLFTKLSLEHFESNCSKNKKCVFLGTVTGT